jgi:two-component system sensor kinase FixL
MAIVAAPVERRLGRFTMEQAESITKHGSSWARGYAIAAGAVLAAGILRMSLDPWLAGRATYLLFTAAVLAAAVLGGKGPAVAATLLSLAAIPLGIHSQAMSFADGVEAATFIAVASCIIWLSQQIGSLKRKSEVSESDARDQSDQVLAMADELNLLVDGADAYAIYMLDREGRVAIWNRGAERLKGWTEDEVLGKHTSIFYPLDAIEAGKPEADLESARETGRLEEEDWRLRKDGSEFLAHITLTPLYDAAGDLRGYGKVLRDVTEERAAERNTRRSEAQLRSVLSTVPDGMIVIDEKGAITSFSTAAQQMFQYSEDELVGRNVSCLMPNPDRDAHDGYLARYLSTGEKRIIGIGRVVTGARKDGTTFPLHLSVGEVVVDDRRIFTGFLRDLTAAMAAEARIEELRSGLIHVARVSAMGTMASTLAHELNQPITAVANYMEGIRDLLQEPDPEDLPMIRDALDDAAGQAMRAGHIVRRLREFVARGEVEKAIEDLPSLVDDAAKLALVGAAEKGITARLQLDPQASPVLVDKVQIQQVLLNLMRNAIEAMTDMPERNLTISSCDDGEGLVRVSVADTGTGIAPGVAENLFQAFNSSKAEGMGLGLSICRTIVEANGGRIWAEPRDEGGTIFHFTLVKADEEIGNDG